ncbi:MAG: DUF2293 domain-containing protein [Verrucomicrobiales bacterium]|nr:DUF2293 domain-containing protein [Verrucomicrobiales bacterium]
MMSDTLSSSVTFRDRVTAAAESALKKHGSVGPLELFERMGFVHQCHLDGWRQGNEYYQVLEAWIQVGPEKYQKTLEHFAEWAKERGMRTIEASYTRRTPRGLEQLHVTEDGDPEREAFYRTHYAPAELSKAKTERLAAKLSKPPDLVVFEKVSEEGNCTECGTELFKGSFLFMEKKQPLCLECADLDHLVFLPAGDMAMTRRARKYSPLSAVVVKFSRSRKRYERQGLLVSSDAILRATDECTADAPDRELRRQQAAVHRQIEDVEFTQTVAQAIRQQFPGCPRSEAQSIAEHTAARGSGRVGRSAAGRFLDARAIELAVIAHIRHCHTNYDELLMQGTDRLDARNLIRGTIAEVVEKWRTSKPPGPPGQQGS